MLVTQKLQKLRKRAGLSRSQIAKQLGYKGASSYQRYEDSDVFKKSILPLKLTEKLETILLGRGNPPITGQEVWDLHGLDQRPDWLDKLNESHPQAGQPVAKLATKRIVKISYSELLGLYLGNISKDNVMSGKYFMDIPDDPELSERTYLLDIDFETNTDRVMLNDLITVDMDASWSDDDLVIVYVDNKHLEPMLVKIDLDSNGQKVTNLHYLRKQKLLPPQKPIKMNDNIAEVIAKVILRISRP